MDFTRLNQGEKVAGVSGVLLILIMFIFKWFGLKASVGVTGISVVNAEVTRNAWGSYGFIDIVLFITALAAIGLALLAASEGDVGLPVAASAIVAGLGILSVILVIISIISPPDFGRGRLRRGDRPYAQARGLAGVDRVCRGGRRGLPGDAGRGDVIRRRGRALRRRRRRRRRGSSASSAVIDPVLRRPARLRPPTRRAVRGTRPDQV